MKNFTNNFKQFTSRLSARWLIMALMLLVGTSSAWAIKIYFDNTNTNWSKVYLIVGHGSYSCFNNQMSVECGNIYSVDVNDWSDETQIAFHGGDSWGCEGNSISHRYGWHNGPFTHPYGITLNNASGKVFTPAGTQSNITTGNGTKQAYNWSSVEPYTFDKNTHCCSAPTSVSISRGAPTTGNICQGSTIDLTANVDGGSGDITYVWTKTSGGNDWTIANASAQKCTVTAGSGSATFEITATRCGTSKTNTINLTADTKPALTLESNPTICQGEQITLSEYVSKSSGTVKWYSNSNRTTEIQDLTVTPSPATTIYYARATNGVCSADDKNLTITVRATPTKYTVSEGSADNKVKLSNSQTNYTYTLYKDGTTVSNSSQTGSTGTALEWTVSSAGTYTVKAKYTGSDCAETAMNGSYTYTPCPTLTTGTVSGATTICSGEGATVSLSGNTTGSTIQWQKSTTSSTSGFANINGATSTSYTADNLTQTTYFRAAVTLPASGNCSAITQNTTAVTVTVRATPTKYTVSEGSADNKVKLSNSQTNYTYTLYKDGTTVSNSSKTGSTGTALEWTVSSAGTYTVKAKYTGSACTETLMNGSYTYTPCVQSATEGTGSFSNGTITLSAKFNTCGSAYIGFQWKEEDNEWCYEDNNTNPCFIPLGAQTKVNETATTTVTKASGKTYVFRPYIVVGNDARNWLYGTEFTVGTCTLPVINSTDASFNPNNFADFAALYVTDCSGKEITGYQWYKGGEEYVSECDYTTKDGSVPGDAGQTNNIRPNAVGNYTCKVTYDDGTSATSAAFTVTATSGTTYANFNSPIPVIMVNTGSNDFPTCPVSGETASKHADEMKEKLSVDVKILHNGSIVYDRKARMAYRGSSSLNFVKKSYAFCPGDANCGDAKKGADYVKTAKLNMLDIGEACDKDWVLYAAAADPSMLRNRMVFETYQAMRPGEWGVKSRYVELIINGEYKGVYLMMDKITQNKKRVNVEWDVKDETKRGFILKFDKTDVADRSKDYPDGDEKTFLSKYSGKHNISTYDTTNDQAFEIEYPEKEDIEDEGGNWYDVINFIQGMINNFETALSAGEYQKVQQIIDYESWADWFILSEYTKNVDAFRASCVFVYDGTKLKATPLWDQELSFNNQSVHANREINDGGNKGCENVVGLLIKNDKVYTDGFAAPFWFTGKLAEGKGTEKLAAKTFTGALLNDPCFVQMVKNRWTAHKSGALSNASLTALITNYEKELTSAVRDREANFWNGKSRNTLSCPWPGHNTGYYDDTYADAKADITAWISDAAASGSTGRRAGLNTAISALEGTGLDIAIKPASIQTTPWVPVVIQVQNETGYEYTLTYPDGDLDKQPNIIIEKSGDTYKYHIPRPAAWPAGNEQQEGERADINYSIKATLQVGVGNNQCGSSDELPSATATITLQDEPNEICQ